MGEKYRNYDWSDYLPTKQDDVYAPTWTEERSRLKPIFCGITVILSAILVTISIRSGLQNYITVIMPPTSGKENAATPRDFTHPEPVASPPSGDRESDIVQQLVSISGPLVTTPGTYRNIAASWIIQDDKLGLGAESPNLYQRYVLALLYFSMGGETWSFGSWLDNDGADKECSWRKVACDGDSRITMLLLDAVNLQGKLPPEIAFLPELATIDFRDNHVTGTIPESWGELKSLEHLYLDGNDIIGSIPDSICTLRSSSLQHLTVDCDTTPSQVICPCCTNCPTMTTTSERLSAIQKKLSSISHPILLSQEGTAQNKAMKWILDEDSSELDSESSNLIQRYCLAVLYFSLGGEEWPYVMWLNGEKSECKFPGVACNDEGEIDTISLVSSDLDGKLPSELSKLTSLKILDLSDNSISGTIPSSLGQLSDLESLLLQHNELTGSISDTICALRLTSLTSIKTDCTGNSTKVSCQCCADCNVSFIDESSPPPSIITMTNNETTSAITAAQLDLLAARENEIRQQIEEISHDDETHGEFREKALSWILTEDPMQVDADDPHLIQRYVLALLYFSLGGENWTNHGEWLLDKECYWTGVTCDGSGRVTEISLASSNLKGTIPDEISYLEDVKHIDMSKNHIVGELPDGLSNLYFLETLYLYDNSFFGRMTPDVCYLTYGKLTDMRMDCEFQCDCCTKCGPP